MKRIVLTALLGFVFLANLFASDPGVVISGVEGNYSIGTFAKGSVVFLNRTMTFGDIPEQFDGWQFTQINAYSDGTRLMASKSPTVPTPARSSMPTEKSV